jgi:hypothetical protein
MISKNRSSSLDYELVRSKASPPAAQWRANFLGSWGKDVGDAFRLYLQPLLGSRMPEPSAHVRAEWARRWAKLDAFSRHV